MSKKMHGSGNYFIFWVIGVVPKRPKKYTKKIERGKKKMDLTVRGGNLEKVEKKVIL